MNKTTQWTFELFNMTLDQDDVFCIINASHWSHAWRIFTSLYPDYKRYDHLFVNDYKCF